jgi:hypothetical protein
MLMDIATRFWAKVDKNGPAECWIWTAAIGSENYGAFALRRPGKASTAVQAHRVAWELANGREAPPEMDVCHTCSIRRCVNPAHLFLGTRADNMRDAADKQRLWTPRKTHCPRGHLQCPENTHDYPSGRRCRICQRKRDNERNAKARQ